MPVATLKRPVRSPLLICLLLLGGCASGAGDAELATATGPPSIDFEAVEEHAEQFDTEVPVRLAGTQEEGVASAYLLGHMQQAGYLVRLDGVPVKDLVRSTNVVAPPPSGEDATAALVVGYDTGTDGSGAGPLGLWLELARALNVAEPDHTVMFVALGANHPDAGGIPLGEKRLVRFLEEEELEPTVLQLENAARDGTLVEGPLADQLASVIPGEVEVAEGPRSCGLQLDHGPPPPDCNLLHDAGFEHTSVTGLSSKIGGALLRYLSEEHS